MIDRDGRDQWGGGGGGQGPFGSFAGQSSSGPVRCSSSRMWTRYTLTTEGQDSGDPDDDASQAGMDGPGHFKEGSMGPKVEAAIDFVNGAAKRPSSLRWKRLARPLQAMPEPP